LVFTDQHRQQWQNAMPVEWTANVKDVLSDARHLSKRLGHFEIVTLAHVYGILLSRLRGDDIDEVAATLTEIEPPWPVESVYLSPGGQTPKLKRALEHAIIHARSDSRAVTIQDIWDALPNGHAETIEHLDEAFGVDRR
jgi:hypothetical protein